MSDIRAYVESHPLFCHHDHHCSFKDFDEQRAQANFQSLLGYATADLVVAAGTERLDESQPLNDALVARLWPVVRNTGYGQAVTLGCQALFGIDYAPENYPAITAALQSSMAGRTAPEIYAQLVHERARNVWTICDSLQAMGLAQALDTEQYLDSYRFTYRNDELFSIADDRPIATLERFTGRSIATLDQMVAAVNASIDAFAATGKLAAIKVGMAYERDLRVGAPTHAEAERAFVRIRNRTQAWDGVQQYGSAVDGIAARALGDFLFHCVMQRASDDNLPVQIHTGYLAGTWGALEGSKALHLVPIFNRYRRVRFDLFHASWPWCSE
ncbi:MAG: hypothetical protein GX557_12835, partial [Chloroflexi bacterium]|nr:hypothetical protein [Chloroflexota bacterium]